MHCAQPQRAAGAGDSLATESTGTILVPRQMSPIAGHAALKEGLASQLNVELLYQLVVGLWKNACGAGKHHQGHQFYG